MPRGDAGLPRADRPDQFARQCDRQSANALLDALIDELARGGSGQDSGKGRPERSPITGVEAQQRRTSLFRQKN